LALITLLALPVAFADGNSVDSAAVEQTGDSSALDSTVLNETTNEAFDLQVFVKMAIHDLDSAMPASSEPKADASAGGNCTVCTSHQQCDAVCGGFGACLRDLGHLCDVGWFTKVCACG